MAAESESQKNDAKASQQPGGVTLPQLSLPKGGGAIRGIDEKFSANPATGTGMLNIPVAVSAGRSGFGPTLSLSYDSGGGNGIFGFGWSLSLPAITRRTDKGVPRYHDQEERGALSDIFVLSGSEDLVPVRLENGDGQQVFDDSVRDGYRIRRYRPRIEGLFARIECWTRLSDGDSHWRSISKDNVLTLYGIDSASRIADPADPVKVFSWLMCQSYDDKGNVIVYSHVAEDERGIDLARPNERHRTRSANRYLKRICYGNLTPLFFDAGSPHLEQACRLHRPDAAAWAFEIVFDYGEGHYRQDPPDAAGRILADAGTGSQHPWPARADAFSSYRAGFEIRTCRLCRRILMFHCFPEELGRSPCLVRSTALAFDEKASGSFIRRAEQCFHKRLDDGRYLSEALPPLDLGYTPSPLDTPGFEGFQLAEVAPDSLDNLQGGIDGQNNRWLDLNAEGIPGVLTEQGGTWFYKPNNGNGRFGATETVQSLPAASALNQNAGTQLLTDVTGDGTLSLVDFSPPLAGFHARTADSGWQGFRAFLSLPVRDWKDPNLRFVDLTGDGIADILVTEEAAISWHPSLLAEGFGAGLRVRIALDEEHGPRIVLANPEQSIYLADMSGDGLSDLVRIRNGEVCYWPNLGYGRFGAKVSMDNVARFDQPDLFEQDRIRLADTDGSGTSDVLYLARDGVHVFLNLAGNGLSSARHLRGFPSIDNAAAVSVTDFLGHGTACLLWSSPLPRDGGRQLRYVDLMCGQKPHLLCHVANNLGAETSIEYASSTEFYLADKAAGKPWISKLPFPVHVVKSIETYDYVSRNRFVTSYTFHHGYYDGVEREFRGFARVEQLDTEELASLGASGAFPTGGNCSPASSVPPVLTKTWFHTGIFLHNENVSRHLAHEYYQEGARRCGESGLSREQLKAMQLNDTVLPQHLHAEEAREACRSLKGSMLRQEVYALDGKEESCRPYVVTENNYTIRILQRRQVNRYAVFFTHAREAVSFHYERKLYATDAGRRADPRVTHEVTLATDDFGNVLKSVAIAYGRRFPEPSPLLLESDRKLQSQSLITLSENSYTNAVTARDAYRTPLPAESRQFQLVGLEPAARLPAVTNLLQFDELLEQVRQAGDGAHDLPFEDWQALGASGPGVYRRLLKHNRNRYRSNRLDCLLPPGSLESLGLPGQSYRLTFTAGLLATVLQRHGPGQPPQALLPDPATVLASRAQDGGAYLDLDHDGNWWMPGSTVFYSSDPSADSNEELKQAAAHFFLPRRVEDPFGNSSTVDFDAHDLLTIRTVDAVGNVVTVDYDYRVMQPKMLTDPNGNRSAAAFNVLELVAGNALMGKAGEHAGDSLAGFRTDLTRPEIDAFFDAPQGAPGMTLLGNATSRTLYDIHRFARTRAAAPANPDLWQPACAAALARETHVSDLAPGQASKIQICFSYSDGFAREVQRKAEADPGPLAAGGPVVQSRWIGEGWTVFNNKGKPVRKYEPFFDDTHNFRFDHRHGVSPILFYDPVGRAIGTLNPDHSWLKSVFDPWRQTIWDANDTVLASEPQDDPDLGDFFRRLPPADYLPSWHDSRISGALGRWQQQAARKAAVHAGTPSLAFTDVMGRMVLSIAHNRFHSAGADKDRQQPQAEFYATRTLFDIEGNHREVIDAKGRVIMRYDYDLANKQLHQASMEAGERWLLEDAGGKPIRAWDSRGHNIRNAYDGLRRHVGTYLSDGGAPEKLVGRTLYGDSLGDSLAAPAGDKNREPGIDPLSANLRGRVVQIHDQSGLAVNRAYDFKGNLLCSRHRLAREYKKTLDWSGEVALEQREYDNSIAYDALNRAIEYVSPDRSAIRSAYNKINLLQRLEANLAGARAATLFIAAVDYNAKRQRSMIEYGNGVRTDYEYDPLTFRLLCLQTARPSARFARDCPAPPLADADWPGCKLQNLHYSYDPVGNITHIHDSAQQSVYFRNRRVDPDNDYTYDAIYRLIEASGREHLGQAGAAPTPNSGSDLPHVGLPQPGDGNAMARYIEQYVYDAVGNILAAQHRGSDSSHAGWTRTYAYQEASQLQPAMASNRLSSTQIGAATEHYRYQGPAGLHGDITGLPQLSMLQWDYRDQLQAVAQQQVSRGAPETTWYVYDANGKRVRKITESHACDGDACMRLKERVYLGNFEIYREYGNHGDDETVALERQTLHIMDNALRLALVETRSAGDDGSPQQLIRYQCGNHLASVSLELDAAAQVISYEEYTPFGASSYQALLGKTPKRYRYTGKERDEESGLEYHGARYYLPWLGRWLNADPLDIKDAVNVYQYCGNNPVKNFDPSGTIKCSELAGAEGAGAAACEPDNPPPATAEPPAAPAASGDSTAMAILKGIGGILWALTPFSMSGCNSNNNQPPPPAPAPPPPPPPVATSAPPPPAAPAPVANVTGNYVLVVGGTSVNDPKAHDQDPWNFLQAAGLRAKNIKTADKDAKITLIMYSPDNLSYQKRAVADGKSKDYFESKMSESAKKIGYQLIIIKKSDELTPLLNTAANGQVKKLEYFGHSNPHGLFLEYSSKTPSVSTDTWGESQAKNVKKEIFAASGEVNLYGCNLGQSGGLGEKIKALWGKKTTASDTDTSYKPIGQGIWQPKGHYKVMQ
ncbi:SpvB/TcaC N-terminal domain-containing protein [Collimonas humicola]|uniref:SpvB/TcaC N-terminal domain-containing protein n=1 Tax=Collimonas humicola TaxID=2825886 RepID=UPI001B8AA7B2|nr:SpvB/TcaC N-terminal domain-containing protein [Collimonas humicola]